MVCDDAAPAQSVSVIIPVHDSGRYLGACLDSILAQSHPSLQIILADDASSDDSPRIMEEYARRDSRILIAPRADKAQGPGATRNRALQLATGEFFCFADSDDLLAVDAVSQLLALLRRHPEADMATGVIAPFADARQPHSARQRSRHALVSGRDAALQMLYQTGTRLGLNVSPCAKLYRTARCRSLMFPGGIYEDLAALPLLARRLPVIVGSSGIVYHYRLHSQSILGSFSPRRLEVIEVCRRLADSLRSDPQLQRAAITRLFAAAFNMRLHLALNPGAVADAAPLEMLIRKYRREVLADADARLRDRLGALAAFCPGIRTAVALLGLSPSLLTRLIRRR